MQDGNKIRIMASLRTILTVLIVSLGICAGPVQAFFPMMLLMLPMMAGGQHGMGASHGSGGEQGTHESDIRQRDGERGAHELHAQQWVERPSSTRVEDIGKGSPTETQQILGAIGSSPVPNETSK